MANSIGPINMAVAADCGSPVQPEGPTLLGLGRGAFWGAVFEKIPPNLPVFGPAHALRPSTAHSVTVQKPNGA